MRRLCWIIVLAGVAWGDGVGSVDRLAAAEPARLLAVTVTTGFRHGSIETAEPVLEKLGRESGLFHVTFLRMPPDRPPQPRPPRRGSRTTDAEWAQLEAEFRQAVAAFRAADMPWQEAVKSQFAAAFSPQTLQDFDGVMFVNTTGELPIPDLAGFLDWLRSGKTFIGMHAATDTLKGSDAYIDMVGGSFAGHPWGGGGEHGFVNHEPGHPVVKMFPERFRWKDEIYQYDARYNPASLRVLLSIDMAASRPQEPWHVPVAWVRHYGQGRVFYTNLGHNPATWEDATYQEHLLSGMGWALGRFEAPAEPNPDTQAAEYLRSVIAAAAAATAADHDALRARADAKIKTDPAWAVSLRPMLLEVRGLPPEGRRSAYEKIIAAIGN
jgi:type 1 glutamine amidotransferase